MTPVCIPCAGGFSPVRTHHGKLDESWVKRWTQDFPRGHMATTWVMRGCIQQVLQGNGGTWEITQGKHNIEMRPGDYWGVTARWCFSSWWCRHPTNHTRSLEREGKTGNLTCKVDGGKGLIKTKQGSFLGTWLMMPVCLTPPRQKSWIRTFPNDKLLLYFTEYNMLTEFHVSSIYVQVYLCIHLPYYTNVKTPMSAKLSNSSGS